MKRIDFVRVLVSLEMLVALVVAHRADAAFVLFDDFETYNLDEDGSPVSATITGLDQVADINDVTSPWDARNSVPPGQPSTRVDFGRIGGNQFLAYGYASQRGAFRALGAGAVANTNPAATYFMRFRVINDDVNHGFGLGADDFDTAWFDRFETMIHLKAILPL